jgi:hypothetical protein
MTQHRSHFFLDVDDDVSLTQIFGQAVHSDGEVSDFLLVKDCAWTSVRVSVGLTLPGCPGRVPAAANSGVRNTSPLDGEERQRHLVSQRRLRLLARCVAYIQRRRSAALVWQLLPRPRAQDRIGTCATAKPPEERTPREFPFITAFFLLALLIN